MHGRGVIIATWRDVDGHGDIHIRHILPVHHNFIGEEGVVITICVFRRHIIETVHILSVHAEAAIAQDNIGLAKPQRAGMGQRGNLNWRVVIAVYFFGSPEIRCRNFIVHNGVDEVICLVFRRCDFSVITLIAGAVDGNGKRSLIRIIMIVGDAILEHIIGCLSGSQIVGSILVGHVVVAAVLID